MLTIGSDIKVKYIINYLYIATKFNMFKIDDNYTCFRNVDL